MEVQVMNLKEKSSNILELLAIEDCENDTWVILNSVERIINAINTWNTSFQVFKK